MRAVVYERYGPPSVLELRDVPTPRPAEDQVLIRVDAASVNRSDWETLVGSPAYVRLGGAGLWRPKHHVLGSDVAGTVEAIGDGVTRFRPGDEVFGDILYSGSGAFAEYVAVSERAPLTTKPDGLSFEQAAALPQSGALALQGLRRVRDTQAGDRVLINGAGGGGGTFALQLAKAFGAEVTAVDGRGKLAMMRGLGADRVVDYTSEDFADDEAGYDRIVDFVGSRSIGTFRRSLRPGGIYSLVGGPVRRLLSAVTIGWLMSKAGSKHLGVLLAKPNPEDLARLATMVVEGTITPTIHRRYELAEVSEALADLGAGRVLGKAIIAV